MVSVLAIDGLGCATTLNGEPAVVNESRTGLLSAAAAQPDRDLPAEVTEVINERVADGRYPGIVVGVIDRDGPRVYGFGSRGFPSDELHSRVVPDGSTIYEIGSITKVFTGVLLAHMVLRGEVRLDAPVADYLPSGVTVPEFEGKPITLLSLTTHTSGLPVYPDNMPHEKDDRNPYADYTAELLYNALARIRLTRAPGERWQYSNLGAGLLGYALSLRAGIGYDELLRARITNVLGLSDTAIAVSESMQSRLAIGYQAGTPAPPWDSSILSGAGGLRSTADDLLRFLAANMDKLENPLQRALELAREIHFQGQSGERSAGLGWAIVTEPNPGLFAHAGGTHGFSSFIAMRSGGDIGAVVLTNAGSEDVSDVCLHLVNNRQVMLRKPKAATEEELATVRHQTLVQNGDFSEDSLAWWQAPAEPSGKPMRVENGSLCLNLDPSRSRQLGWPTAPELALKLQRGQRYSLFFRASSVGPLAVKLQVKVAHREPPYTAVALSEVQLAGAPTLYRMDFVATDADDSAGIGLILATENEPGESTFCIDDLVLVPDASARSDAIRPPN